VAARRVSPPGVLITKSFDKMMRPAIIASNTINRQTMTRPSLHREEFHRLLFDLFLIKFFGLTAPKIAATTPVDPAKNSEAPVVVNHIRSRTNRVLLLKALT
jgi:hypothetical protein